MKLNILVDGYICYRKSLGEQMKVNKECLRLFCRAIRKDIHISDVTPIMVKNFLYSGKAITSRWFSKYYALLGFYQYAISRGYIHKSPLPKLLPKRPPPFVPYIYSREELRRIFKAVLEYKDKNLGHLDPYMIRVVLILLYSTGLRLNEALSLTMEDVDISHRLIKVCETKFYKTRHVPFSNQLSAILEEYLCWRNKNKSPQDLRAPLFITVKGKTINSLTIEFIFRRIRKIANIQRIDKASYQPRIHDLRHTFAVHRLISWYQDNKNVQKLLPVLSTYLGHTQLSATSVYLTMTNDMLSEAGTRFEKYALGGTHSEKE